MRLRGSWKKSVVGAVLTLNAAACGGGAGGPVDAGGGGGHQDVTAPVVSLAPSAPLVARTGSLELTATATDEVGVVRVEFFLGATKLGEDTAAPYTLTVELVALDDGAALFHARALDAAGNAGLSSDVSVAVDGTAPAVALASERALVQPAGTVLLEATASDALAGVARVEFFEGAQKLGEAASAPFRLALPLQGLAEGPHTLHVRAVDRVGNAADSAPLTLEVDGTAPGVALAELPGVVRPAGSVTLSATVTDASSVVAVSFFDGATLLGEVTSPPWELPVSLDGAAAGAHAYFARAGDAAGNVGESAPVSLTVDATPPSVGLSSPSAVVRPEDSLTLHASATDALGVTQVALFDGTEALSTLTAPPYDFTLPLAGLPDGTHSYRVEATDVAGNVATSDVVQVTVDGTAPEVGLAALSGPVCPTGTLTVSATASDAQGVVAVEFWLDGVEKGTALGAPYTLALDLAGLGDGAHTLVARARDVAGNVGASSPVELTVDGTPPAVTLGSVPAVIRPEGTLTLTALASDAQGVAAVEFWLDGATQGEAATAPYTLGVDVGGLADGTHTVQARARDAAGNVGQSTTASFVSDGTAPQVTLASSTSRVTEAGSFTLTAEATDARGVVRVDFYDGAQRVVQDTTAPFQATVTVTEANNGQHAYTARAFDAAGNVATSAVTEVTVAIPDVAAPTVSLQASTSTVTGEGTPLVLTAVASDNVGVTQVEFFDGATSVGVVSTAPFTLSLALGYAQNGAHSYSARASDAAGNTATSNAVSVTATVRWTQLWGTSSQDGARALAADGAGNLFVAGTTQGQLGAESFGLTDATLTRYEADRARRLWTTQWGSGADDYVTAVAVAADGSIYVTGHTRGAMDASGWQGGEDAFLTKVRADGQREWTRVWGTAGNDRATGVVANPQGGVWVTGYVSGSFDGQATTGGTDGFIVRFDAGGTRTLTRLFGTADTDYAQGLGIDLLGNLWVTGVTFGTFPGKTAAGGGDGFVVFLSGTDGTVARAFQFGGATQESPLALVPDETDGAWVVGKVTVNGWPDAFLAHVHSDGTTTLRTWGAGYIDEANAVVRDALGNVYVTGTLDGALDGEPYVGGGDSFVMKFDKGFTRLWTREFGSRQPDEGYGLALSPDGSSAYVAGWTVGAFDGAPYAGSGDLMLVKYTTADGVRQ